MFDGRVYVAWPLLTVADPSVWDPLTKSTVPVTGAPPDEVTVAVSVTVFGEP